MDYSEGDLDVDHASAQRTPLTPDEKLKVFELVKRGRSVEEAQSSLRGRDRTTVSRLYKVVAAFERYGAVTLDGPHVTQIAEEVGYSTSPHYVRDLFLEWRSWRHPQQESQGINGDESNQRRHSGRVIEVSARLREQLGHFPPPPDSLFGSWEPDDLVSAIRGNPFESEAVRQHLAKVSLAVALDALIGIVRDYETLAKKALGEVKTGLLQLEPGDSTYESRSLWVPIAQRAHSRSKRYGGSDQEAEGEFAYLYERPKAKHRDGSQLVSWDSDTYKIVGPSQDPDAWSGSSASVVIGDLTVGSVSSLAAARDALRHIDALLRNLPKSAAFSAVVEKFYEIVDQRDRLREMLSPTVYEKLAVDGHCEWCPGESTPEVGAGST